jgi:hypothetical protein
MAVILKLVNGIPRHVDIVTGGTSWDEEELLASTLTANTNYTIPNSRTYTMGNLELNVFVDGSAMRVGTDYVEVSSTQIKFPNRTINTDSRVRIRR